MAEEGLPVLHDMASFKEAIGQDGVTVVDFFADWCGPCKVLSPVITGMSKQFTDAKFYKVDVEEAEDVAAELAITAMPTIIVFKKGEKIDSVRGANPPAIMAMVQKALA